MRALLIVAVLFTACKKEKAADKAAVAPAPAAPASTAEQDALWKLAPSGLMVGMVASPRGVAHLEGAALAIKKLFATAPELVQFGAKLDAELTKNLGTSNVSLAEFGLARDKGFAFFARKETAVVIIPVADRDKFLKVTKGTKGTDSDKIGEATCKTVHNVYACANPPALLDELGKGTVPDFKLAGARGDVEIVGEVPGPTGAPVAFGAAFQLDRGAVVIRGGVRGVPEKATAMLRDSAKPRVDANTAAFAVMNIKAALANLPPSSADPLFKSVNGPVTVTIPSGSMVFDVRVPLADEGPAKQLVESCDKIPQLKLAGATVTNGVCHVSVPQMMMELDAWVANKELRIGKKDGAAAGAPVTLSPIGKELASTQWAVAMYGRGSMIGLGPMAQMALAQAQMGNAPPEVQAGIRGGLRALVMFNEHGLGVRMDGDVLRFLVSARTSFANPDDVVAKLSATPVDDLLAKKEAGEAIAKAAPGSPFAADLEAGIAGMMIPAATIGALAAVAIPAFMDYMKKSKKSEAALQLNKLGKNLKVLFATNGAFPKGKVPLTPAKSCCDSKPAGKCLDAAAWKHPIWTELEMSIDEPHLFRYSYESDGKTFTAKAVGDLDCDGKEIAYVLQGTKDAQGNVTTSMTEPEPNTD